MEGEKGDADRQEYIQMLDFQRLPRRIMEPNTYFLQERCAQFTQEIEVFKIAQHTQIDAEAQHHQPFLTVDAFCPAHDLGNEEIGSCREHQQPEPNATAFVIKIEGKQCHINQSSQCMLTESDIKQAKKKKKDKEKPTAEQHWRSWLVRKNLT